MITEIAFSGCKGTHNVLIIKKNAPHNKKQEPTARAVGKSIQTLPADRSGLDRFLPAFLTGLAAANGTLSDRSLDHRVVARTTAPELLTGENMPDIDQHEGQAKGGENDEKGIEECHSAKVSSLLN